MAHFGPAWSRFGELRAKVARVRDRDKWRRIRDGVMSPNFGLFISLRLGARVDHAAARIAFDAEDTEFARA